MFVNNPTICAIFRSYLTVNCTVNWPNNRPVTVMQFLQIVSVTRNVIFPNWSVKCLVNRPVKNE